MRDFSEMRDFSGLGELTNCGKKKKKKTENIVTRSARLSLRLKRSKIVHCLVHVNSTEKMLNTAMTTRGGAVFVVR